MFLNAVSFIGLFLLAGAAWLFSSNRRVINWRLLGWGLVLQLAFGAFVFLFPPGMVFFIFINKVVIHFMDSATYGIQFVFGKLADPAGQMGFILAFQGLPAIVFFSAVMALLYYFRVMPVIIGLFSRIFTRLFRISGAESLCTASNIFVGVESTLVIKPYLGGMTRSELCVVLTAGMATVASNVLLLYVSCLRGAFPNIAGHLVSASILSAPAALIMSKLVCPEDGVPATMGRNIEPYYEKESSMAEALINGANTGVKLILGIVALLLAVLGMVQLFNSLLGWFGSYVNSTMGWNGSWSLQGFLGYLFYPFIAVTGVAPEDCAKIARIVGARLVVTEIPGYIEVGNLMAAGGLSSPRSAILASYSLTGFAHIASLAIFVGGAASLAPERIRDLSSVGWRALLAANLACLMTACIAGVFITGDSLLFSPH